MEKNLFTSKMPSFSVALTHSSLYSSILGESTCKSLISQNVSRFWSLIKFVSPYPYCPQVAWGSRCCCSGRPRGSMLAWSNFLDGWQWAHHFRKIMLQLFFRKTCKKKPILRSKICNINYYVETTPLPPLEVFRKFICFFSTTRQLSLSESTEQKRSYHCKTSVRESHIGSIQPQMDISCDHFLTSK